MSMLVLIAALLAGFYGAFTVFAGIIQVKAKNIPAWIAIGMVACGFLTTVSAVFVARKAWLAFYLLLIGLVGIHILAVTNGLKMYGKINMVHHLVRAALSVFIVVLAFLSMHS
ncbi:hypothetical protein DRJ23_06940 [Candidatus Acetothermia bacterium]|nr:MAG: hypothetical protein DRJ23_06940 [Candidatus Acetothermia bacterium]